MQPFTVTGPDGATPLATIDSAGNLIVAGALYAAGIPAPSVAAPGRPLAPAPVLGRSLVLVATTGLAGAALTSGTPSILSWTAPDDGQPHRVMVIASQSVTTDETGGEVTMAFTLPDGSAGAPEIFSGGSNTGTTENNVGAVIAPGTKVTVAQGSGLSTGAATVWIDLMAS